MSVTAAPGVAAALPEATPRRAGRRWLIFALLAPVLVFFIVWNTIPTLWLLGLSFYRFSLTSGRPPIPFGLGNYAAILEDGGVWLDLSRTLVFMATTVTIETVLGVLLGLLFWGSARLPGRGSRSCTSRASTIGSIIARPPGNGTSSST